MKHLKTNNFPGESMEVWETSVFKLTRAVSDMYGIQGVNYFVNLGFLSQLDLLSVVTGQNESQGNVSEQLLLIIIINTRGQMTNCPL